MSTKTILIIDDDVEMLILLRKIVEGGGFRALTAETLDRGEELIEQEAPHLILLDVYLGGQNGLSFLDKRVQVKRLSQIPVIIISGDTQRATVLKAMMKGADDYITKPIKSAVLLQKFKKFLKETVLPVFEVNPDVHEADIEISFPGHIKKLSEVSCIIEVPAKLQAEKGVKLKAELIDKLGGSDLHFKTTGGSLYSDNKLFRSEILFVGISDRVSAKIRKFNSYNDKK